MKEEWYEAFDRLAAAFTLTALSIRALGEAMQSVQHLAEEEDDEE